MSIRQASTRALENLISQMDDEQVSPLGAREFRAAQAELRRRRIEADRRSVAVQDTIDLDQWSQ